MLLALALRRGLRRPFARVAVGLRRSALPGGVLLLVIGYLQAGKTLPTRPKGLGPTDGWWAWYDQGKTLEAVIGWRMHAPSIANQWYQPLYPASGALGLALTPGRPFLLPDLAGLVASFLLFVPLAGLLGIGRLAAIAVFLLINLGEARILDNWIIPWNTSLTTPLLLLGLLSAAKVATGGAGRLAWAAGFGVAMGLIPALRPTDLLALVPGALVAALALAVPRRRAGGGAAAVAKIAFAAAGGFVPAFAVFLLLYVPIFGLHPSPYMVMSSQTGFDWHLLPLHWVTLVVGPRPLFPNVAGMIEVFWWLAPCFAGLVAVLLTGLRSGRMGSRRVHLIIVGGIVPYWCLYLSYRDLHPPGLWTYNNFHYFMWTFPLLGLYGVLLLKICGVGLRAAWRGGALAGCRAAWPVAAGALLTVLGLAWRPELGPSGRPRPTLDVVANEVLLPGGLSSIHDALVVSALDPGGQIYFGTHSLRQGGQSIGHFNGFRAFPIPGGTMVLPLRVLPAADGILRFAGGVRLDSTFPPEMLRQDMVLGLPCWAPRIVRPASCLLESPLPGPPFPVGRQIDFDSRMEVPYLIPGGWTDQQDGRWTLGYHSSVQFRVPVPPPRGSGVVVEVEGAGFMPRGSDHLAIDTAANGTRLGQWRVSTTDGVALRANVPASLIPADGQVRFTISVLNARRPFDTIAGDTDRRLLGFRVRAVRLLPWSEHQPG